MKKIFSLILCICLVIPLFCLEVYAAEEDKWLFIDGENLTRTVDSAIIYRNIESTKQNQWGNNVVCDAEGIVTAIIESGKTEGENLAVPEGGFVISASGAKGAWLKKNIKKGDKLFYDAYTQRLFKFDGSGLFDPYFTKSFDVSELSDGYVIKNIEASATPLFSYDVVVDAKGFVASKGSNLVVPEGGFRVSAATRRDMESLIAYAPLGAKCVVAEGVLTFTYDKTMLNTTLNYALDEATKRLEAATASSVYADLASAQALIDEVRAQNVRGINYRTASALAYRLTDELNIYLCEAVSAETRAAFHTPTEKDIISVRDVIKSLKNAGLNTLYLRITNGYGTCVPLPDDNKFKQDEAFSGFDVLRAYITVCEEEGISLGLCFDVFYNEFASIAAPEWVLKSNGEADELADKYYSPTSAEFLEYYSDYIGYILTTYGVSEIMLDSLRYPKQEGKADFGYDYVTMQNFATELGISIDKVEAIKAQLFDSPYWNQWVEYRKKAVDLAASKISEAIKEARPDARIIAVSARDTVEHFYMQDCIGWLESGIIDGITLSLTDGRDGADKNDELAYFDSTVTEKGEIISAYTDESAFFFVALESDATIPSRFIESAINEGREINSDGFIFASLDGYLSQNYYQRLSLGAMKSSATSNIKDTDKAITEILDFSKEKLDFYLNSGVIDDSLMQSALAKINILRVKIDNGEYTKDDLDLLESDMALIFAESPIKDTVLDDFRACTKLALLKKEEFIPEPPIIDDESSAPDESDDVSDESELYEESTEEEIVPDTKKEKIKVEIGVVLIYLFVGITLIAAFISMTVALKRKSKRPKGSHMPRASFAENNDKTDE